MSFDNGGDLSPANSPGILTLTGNFNQGATGRLFIELGGTEVGSGYDQLVIGGTALLGGTLALCLLDGFVPAIGQTLTIVTPGTVGGAFDQVSHSGSMKRRAFEILYSANTVTLGTQLLQVSTFEEWRRARFSASELGNALISGIEADPDRDGFNNLMEDVFGLRPTKYGPNPLRVDVIQPPGDADSFLTLAVPWADGMVEASFVIETSSDLETWSPATTEDLTTDTQTGVKNLLFKISAPTDQNDQLFARLRVNKP